MRPAAKSQKSLARIELTLTGILLSMFIAALIWLVPAQSDSVGSTGVGSSILPFTGSDVRLFVVAAVVAVALGALLTKRSGRV